MFSNSKVAGGAALLAAVLSTVSFAAHAGKADAIAALNQRMAAAQARYQKAQQSLQSGVPNADKEADAALADMESTLDDCSAQKGCAVGPMLATYKKLLKDRWADDGAGTTSDDTLNDENDEGSDLTLEQADSAHAGSGDTSTSARVAELLNDQKHDFDKMVTFNAAVEAGIRRWLTDMRSQLIDSYENYMNMRAQLYAPWQQDNLPEALLFGIMAKESYGKVHAVSRTGAAGPLQFMPSTGRRFGVGMDSSGFDTRFDARSVGQASADYVKEQMAAMGNSIEFTVAAYNGGEGRAQRVYAAYPGRSFWDESVYRQFPAETRDYVPMVIAAGWLFLHPKQFGLKFPKVNPKPALLTLAQPASLNSLTICLGNGGTRDGFQRTLRNLNPRYRVDSFLPAGTQLQANSRIVSLYKWYCTDSARAELTATLMNASVVASITRNGDPLPEGVVSVGDATALDVGAPVSIDDPVTTGGALAKAAAASRAAKAKKEAATAAKTYKVKRGETLGEIADKHDCGLKALAKANGLRPPSYVVRPGQVLKMAMCGK